MASSLETGDLSLEAAGHEPGILRFNRKYGPFEERTLILETEALLAWAGEAGASDDVMRIDGPLEVGDIVLGGFGKVLTAGGETNAVIDVITEGSSGFIVSEMDCDATVGTVKGNVFADEGVEGPEVITAAETFVDAIVSGAAAITEEEPGVWQVTYYLLKGSEAWKSAKAYLGAYVGDPNTGPQVPATAEA